LFLLILLDGSLYDYLRPRKRISHMLHNAFVLPGSSKIVHAHTIRVFLIPYYLTVIKVVRMHLALLIVLHLRFNDRKSTHCRFQYRYFSNGIQYLVFLRGILQRAIILSGSLLLRLYFSLFRYSKIIVMLSILNNSMLNITLL
jgi:hypothetical protein